MAAITHVLTDADTSASPVTTAGFTPAAGEVLVVFVVTSGDADVTLGGGTLVSSVSGQTFDKVNSILYNSSTGNIQAFVGTAVTTAVSQTVTFDSPADTTTGQVIFVCSVSGLSLTGIEAVRQFASVANQAGPSTTGPTFGAAALTGNPCLMVVGNVLNPAAVTPPSGWTELADSGYSTPTTGAEYSGINSGFTGTAITIGSSVSTYGALALEMETGAASGTGVLKEVASSFTTASGSKTAAVTAVVGDVMVVVVANTGQAAAATVTDNNADGLGAYTEIVSALKNSSADRIAIFIRNAPCGSAGSTTVTMAPGTTTGGGLVVLRCSGIQAGSTGVRGSGSQANAASGTPTLTLSTAADVSDFCVAGIFNGSGTSVPPAPLNLSARGGFLTYGTPTTGFTASSRASGFRGGTTMTWNSAAATYGDVGVAIKQSARIPRSPGIDSGFGHL